MKSILWQLSKYNKEQPKETTIEVKDENQGTTIDFEYLARVFQVSKEKLHNIPFGRWIDILYPIELFVAHHLHIYDESFCDKIIKSFLRFKDPAQYRQDLMKAVDDTSKAIILYRMLVASTSTTKKEYEWLPPNTKSTICSLLGIDQNVTRNEAYSALESGFRSSSIEQNIIGRLGYMFIWSQMQRQNPNRDIKFLGINRTIT